MFLMELCIRIFGMYEDHLAQSARLKAMRKEGTLHFLIHVLLALTRNPNVSSLARCMLVGKVHKRCKRRARDRAIVQYSH